MENNNINNILRQDPIQAGEKIVKASATQQN